LRATAPASASAGNASARSAAPQASDAAAGSKSFSDILAGAPARAESESTPTATGGKSSPKSTPASVGKSKSTGPTAASASKTPARSSQETTADPADPADAADPAAAKTNTSAAASSAPVAASTDATAAAGSSATASATASAVDDTDDAEAVLADAGLPNSGTPAGAAGAKPGRRTSPSDGAAGSNLMSAQAVWLMAASTVATSAGAAAAPPAAPAAAAGAQTQNTATALAALTGNTSAADAAPVSASSTGGDSTAAAASSAAGTAASVLSDFQVVPNTLATASDQGSSGDPDTGGDDAQASPDRARAATDVSSTDLAGLAQLVRGVAPGNAQTGGIERSIATAVTDPGWSRDVAAQVQMMASAKVQSATLRLSPEHLGPVEVHIDMQASQINVNFVAAHPDTRSALEQSVPTLRAMLAHGGLTLGQTQVQGEARSGSQSGGRARDNSLPTSGEEPMTVAAVRGAGLIDEYA